MASFNQNPLRSSSTKSPERRDSELTFQNNDTSNVMSLKNIGTNVNLHRVTILNRPEEVFLPSNEIQTSKKQEGSVNTEVVSARRSNEGETYNSCSEELCMPILPWINGDGTINGIIYDGLRRRVLGTVMQNPGILEDELVRRMDVLNPQSCKQLLELMILDGHLKVREMLQSTKVGPPALLGTILGSRFSKSKLECRKHFFANLMSTSLL
ncbi:uncharacterized protein LOC110817006 [Carica papaya]|uniref:uncharacterized protein LOC110817006 n=1 Tax=Carica papaya TaxID=3649 RepID=UPI000B8CB362|nr:uncharacterized protein LOC110817006 [Carica papaya]